MQHALLTLVNALIVSKVDYCISVLAGVSGHLQDRLQSVLNSAARLVYSARRSEHISPLLQELHWLKVQTGSDFGCVYWLIAAFMAQRHLSSLTAFT